MRDWKSDIKAFVRRRRRNISIVRLWFVARKIAILHFVYFHLGMWLTGERQYRFRAWVFVQTQQTWLWGQDEYVRHMNETQKLRMKLLKEYANPLCPYDCGGRGWTAYNMSTQRFNVCQCVHERIEQIQNIKEKSPWWKNAWRGLFSKLKVLTYGGKGADQPEEHQKAHSPYSD